MRSLDHGTVLCIGCGLEGDSSTAFRATGVEGRVAGLVVRLSHGVVP